MKSDSSEDAKDISQGEEMETCLLIKVRGKLNDKKREQLKEIMRDDLLRSARKLSTTLMIEIVG
jgi:hypothetical protein